MNETYVECLVKGKAKLASKLLRVFLVVLTAIFCLGILMFGATTLTLLLAMAAGIGAYFSGWYCSVEYEYLYVDREISVDKILSRSARKRVGTFTLERMEIMAPMKSHHLDAYKNRNVKVKDYSIGEELQPDLRYVIYYEGGTKIIISPSEELVKVLKNVAPRKVFTD